MVIVKDRSPVFVSLNDWVPEVMGILGFFLFIYGLFTPQYDENGTIGLKLVIGGGILMITAALLSIERKLPEK